jgi:2'-5' RNA ligase
LDLIEKIVPEEDLYMVDGFKREVEPHVTLLYGLHPEVMVSDLKQYLLPIDDYVITLKNISTFVNNEFNVVKFDVSCPSLYKTNKILCENLPYTTDFPIYHPHMTLAYTNPGTKIYNTVFSAPLILKPESFKYSMTNDDEIYF